MTQLELFASLTRVEPLKYRAARLAIEIRRESPLREVYHYPAKMELATTCCCHIVVDDLNFTDDCVASCIIRAAREEHPKCLQLALLLARASLTQRRIINRLAWSWTSPDMEEWD